MRIERIDRRDSRRIGRVPRGGVTVAAASGSRILRCTILENEEDYLVCRPIGTTRKIIVAKPYEFQRTAWHDIKANGIHYNFLDIDRARLTKLDAQGNLTSTQLTRVIVPPYGTAEPNARNRIIWVAVGVEGGTGVKPEEQGEQVLDAISTSNDSWTVDANSGWRLRPADAIHSPGNTGVIRQKDALIEGSVYSVQFTVADRTAGQVAALCGLTSGDERASSGTFTQVLTCGGSLDFGFLASVDFDGRVHTATATVITPAETPYVDMNFAGRQWLDENS